jgi:peptidoglycan/xylan/chitin deacetylase (PgdA/CDA1 family)
MYHEIYGPEESRRLAGLTNPAYNTDLILFKRQMAWLSARGVKALTIDELLSEKPDHSRNAVCLTFDDGWLGNYHYGYAVLRQYGFKATFFVATGLIGTPSYMTWEHLEEMATSGMSVESHTKTHRPLGTMKDEETLLELSESKKEIEERLGTKVRHLSLPHGSKNRLTWHVARKCGYKSICTSDVGFFGSGSAGPWLKRISIGDGVSFKKFQSIAEGRGRAIVRMKTVKEIKKIVREIIGIKNYRKVYQRVYGIR